METVLVGLAKNSCMVYLDDMLVIGTTFDNHLQNLRQAFVYLQGAGLCLKPKKCGNAECRISGLHCDI